MKVFVTACLFAGAIVFPAHADIIYFKDGMKTICQERAWEENGEIKCEYAGWVLTYQKTDVLRILKTARSEKSTRPPQKSNPAKTGSVKKPDQLNKTSASAPTTKKNRITKKIKAAPDPNAGPLFYDPRRPYKYWANKNSKHKNYRAAIQALAKKYKRTPQWVQTHMGSSNDLTQIHRNLANPASEPAEAKTVSAANQTPDVAFYNPRRAYPYWIDKESRYKSYTAAIKALAKKYDRPPDWVKQNMGASNDLGEIHKNLKESKARQPSD